MKNILLTFLENAYAVTLQTQQFQIFHQIKHMKIVFVLLVDFPPLNEDNNLSFLIYVICVTSFLAKGNPRPWKYLKLGKKIEEKKLEIML